MVKIPNEPIELSLKDYIKIKNNLLSDLAVSKCRPEYFNELKDLFLRVEDKILIMEHNQACSNLLEYKYGLSFISCDRICDPLMFNDDFSWRYRVYYKSTNQSTLDITTEFKTEFVKISRNTKGEFEYTIVDDLQ